MEIQDVFWIEISGAGPLFQIIGLIALIMNMNPILTAREVITGISILTGLTGTFAWQNATAMRGAGHGHM
jgi:hypothetical protein